MKIRELDSIPFTTLMDCFYKSFKNYFVEMPEDNDYFEARFKSAKVRYDLSYGMFDEEKLVGFIINGIDSRCGELIAYNTGTGVLPEYRGRKITKKIYDHAIPKLKQEGITKCLLEVIKENEIAIKTYRNIGFEICRNYKCFSGKINTHTQKLITLKEVTYEGLSWEKLPNQQYYSWDNHRKSLREGKYTYMLLMENGDPLSYFVINQKNGYVAQFEQLTSHNGGWEHLFAGIKQLSKTVKINNVDERATEKIAFLNKIGLDNKIDQYEMEMSLN